MTGGQWVWSPEKLVFGVGSVELSRRLSILVCQSPLEFKYKIPNFVSSPCVIPREMACSWPIKTLSAASRVVRRSAYFGWETKLSCFNTRNKTLVEDDWHLLLFDFENFKLTNHQLMEACLFLPSMTLLTHLQNFQTPSKTPTDPGGSINTLIFVFGQ